ncbi:MAG: DUF7933 domain-containing protein, partial [Usitatibacter sp.]
MRRKLLAWLFSLVAAAMASGAVRAEVFYGVEANGIWSVDANLGGPATQLTTFAAPLASPATLATRPSDGMLFYLDTQVANPNLWRWNPLTPAVPPVLVGGTGLGAGVIRLVFDAGGTLYAMNSAAGATLWTLNQNTGAFLTAIPTSGAVTPGGGDICIHPSTGVMYLVAAQNLYTITPAGVVTLLGAVTGLPANMTGCAFDRNGRLVTSPNATLYQVNTTTLAATALPNATGAPAFGDLATAPGRTSDLSLTKTASNATPGTTVSFTITVTNSGPDTDTNVQVLDLLPVGLTFVSAVPSQGSYTSGTGVWLVGALNNGASATLTINASVTTVGAKTNTAQVSYADNFDPDSTPNNNVAGEDDQKSVTITPSPDLQVTKTATSTFAVGVNGTYSIAVNNTLGSAPTVGTYTVTDNLPAGLTFVSAAGTGWTCAANVPAAGDNVVGGTRMVCTNATVIAAGGTNANAITLTVLPAAGAAPSVTNTATISGGGEPASNNGNDSSTITTSVCLATCPDIRVTKAGPASFTVGVNGTYTITANNTLGGLATSANYTVTDTLPAGMTIAVVPAGVGWVCTANTPLAGDNIVGGGRVVCTSATVMAAGAANPNAITVQVVASNAAVPSAVNNVSIAGGGEPPGNTGNNTFQLTTPVNNFDLQITKTGPASINLGGTGTYTFSVRNTGAVATSGTYTVTDPLPAGITISTVPVGTGWTCTANTPLAGDNIVGGGRVVCTSATVIAAGGTNPNNLTVLVAAAAAAVPSATNTATVSHPSEAPAFTGNNTSTITTPINAPDLVVSKAHNGNFSVGTNGVYTITPNNIGAQASVAGPCANPPGTAATCTTIADNLPAGMTFVSAAGTGWTCGVNVPAAGDNVVGGTRMVCTSATSIPANSQGNAITLTVAVAAAALPSKSNTVTISGGGEPANNNGNNSDTDVTSVFVTPTFTKAFAPNSFPAGGTSVLTFTIGNPAGNSVSLAGISFTDPFPAGMSVAAVPGFSSTCGGAASPGSAQGDTLFSFSGGGGVAAGANCTITITVTSVTVGAAQVNTTSQVATTNSGTGPAATNTFTVTAPGTPTLTKLSAPDPIGVNRNATLTFTITNKATATAGMAFTDTFPANVIYQGTVSNGCAGTLTNNLGGALVAGTSVGIRETAIGLGAGATCTIVVNISSATPGAYNNANANITGLAGGLVANVNDTLNVVGPTLTKTIGPSPAIVSTPSTLTFTITNGAGSPQQQPLAFTDTLPAGLVVASAPVATQCNGTVTAVVASNTITFAGGNLAAGQASCTISVDVTSAAVGTYTNAPGNMSGLSAGMTNSANASVTFYSIPVLTKAFAPTSIAVGGTTTLTFTLTVPAGNPTQTFSFTDTLPAGLVATGGAAGGTCSGGSVTAGAGSSTITVTNRQIVNPATTCTITVPVTTSGTPTLGACPQANNTNDATSIGTTTNITNSVASQCVGVYTPATLTKSFNPTTIGAGGTSALRLVLTNPAGNGVALTGVNVTDPLGTFNLSVAAPVTVTFSPAACGTVQSRAAVGVGVFGATTAGHLEIQFAVASLAAGASCQVDVNVTSATVGAAANTTATPTATGPVALTGTAANATLTVFALATVAKSFAPASIGTNDTSVLTITLTNSNAAAITGAAFTDNYPANLVNTAAASGATTCAGGTVTAVNNGTSVALSGATIPASGSCTVTVNVTSAIAGAYLNNTGAVTTTNAGTAASASSTLNVRLHPTLAKAFAPATVGVNVTSVLTITLTNPNAVAITGAAFTDTYPASLVNATPATGATTCAGGVVTAVNGAGSVALSGATIPASGSCTVTVNVTSAIAGSYANSIAIGALTSANAGANTAAANATLTVLSGLTVAKAFAPASIGTSDTSVLTITLTNPNAVAVTGAAFTDNYPVNLVNTAAASG